MSAADLDELILTLNRGLGVTVVLVTHELASIFKVATEIIMLDKETRSLVARGDPRQLRDHAPTPKVRQFFNREASV